jgi:hypothetical protein
MKILEEEPPLANECKLPWLIDAFLYPVSASGMINLLIFVFLPLLASFIIRLLGSFLLPYLQYGTSYILAFLTVPFYAVFYGYMFYYISGCVVDSAKGKRRADDVTMPETFDTGDLISQVILLLGCVAICFGPTGAYYVLTQRTDLWFWLLLAYGILFLPMSFLRGVMFDSFDALNPILIIRSVFSTLLPYCGLVLFFCVLGGFIAIILPRLPLWAFLLSGIRFYLIFVLAHRLGWFYWWYKDRLDWGI